MYKYQTWRNPDQTSAVSKMWLDFYPKSVSLESWIIWGSPMMVSNCIVHYAVRLTQARQIFEIIFATGIRLVLDCPRCSDSFAHERSLKAHIRIKHDGIKLNCPHCTQTFTRRLNLLNHIRNVHSSNWHQVGLECPHCNHSSHVCIQNLPTLIMIML